MNFEQMRVLRNENNPFAKLLHIELIKIGPGYGEAVMPVTKDLMNIMNLLHGGCLYTIADVAAGAAAASYGETSVTLNAEFHYLRPGKPCRSIRAVAEELKRGRSIKLYRVSVYDQDEILLAEGTFTYFSLEAA